MPMFRDNNGNPIIVTLDQIIQRIFNPFTDTLATGRNAGNVGKVASAALTANATQGPFTVGQYDELAVDVNISAVAGTSPTYQLFVDRLGADGVWYPIYTGTTQNAPGKISLSMGVMASTNVSFGSQIQIREVVGGTSPSFTRSISIVGK